jgi:2-amino-4-hydroxy-6-hydroxymethyldihydropteridine diphosphokinase
MFTTYIGIGSNLSNPVKQVQQAILALKTLESSLLVCASSLYESHPMGPQDQPNYINAVVQLDTNLSPLALLDALQAIENMAGRIRKENRWGPRVLDLDILLYGDLIISNERLTVPHYGMKLREFVIVPLAEIAPNLHLPDGDILQKLATTIEQNNLIKL